jgi:PAS domain S-box-containing protein
MAAPREVASVGTDRGREPAPYGGTDPGPIEVDWSQEYGRTLTRLSGSIARLGGWSIEAGSTEVRWSPELYALLEWEGDDPPDLEAGLAMYTDPAPLSAAVADCLTAGTPFDLEVGVTTARGRALDVRVAAVAERASDGRVLRVIGMFQDITVQQQQRRESLELAERLRATMESTSDGIYLLDEDWRFTYVNPPGAALLQRDPEELLGSSIWEAFPETVGSALFETYHEVRRTARPQRIDEFHYPPLATWFEVNALPSADGVAVFFRDIGEQIERERMLAAVARDQQAAVGRLRELDAIKNAFLSAVSHELRTPLTVVKGMGQTLQRLRDRLSDDQRHRIEDALVGHAIRLEQLLGDLLDVDRLARGTLVTKQECCDLVPLVRDAAVEAAAERPVTLRLPRHLDCVVDRRQIERIVGNLVANARKYAPDGPIEVHLSRLDPVGARLEVADRGPGIPAGERERVFDPLFRLSDANPAPGTGIGLSLVRAFAELHGGTATALEDPDGARIRVDLPCDVPKVGAGEVAPTSQR